MKVSFQLPRRVSSPRQGTKTPYRNNKRNIFNSTTASMEFYSIHYRQNLLSNKFNSYMLSTQGLYITKSKIQKGRTVF